jgi:tripartite ATP-independent transporter DctM subunit
MNYDASTAIVLLLGSFFLLIILRLPVIFAMCASTILTMLYTGTNMMTMMQRMASSINSFSLLAIPFFLLAGEIMGAGGVSDQLVEVSNALVGRFRGGLGHVNVLASMLFGGMSGSSAADIASLGPIEMRLMNDSGYDPDYSCALTITSSCQGVLIPPSHNMIIYSMAVGGVSVGGLFMAGMIPGIMLGLLLMVANAVISYRRHYPVGEKVPFLKTHKIMAKSSPAVLTILIILCGVSFGFFTATESAAIACLWAFFVSTVLYLKLKMRMIPQLLFNVLKSLAVVFGLIASAGAFAYMVSKLNIPTLFASALIGISSSKIVVFMLINLMLLVLGCIMDMAPLILICSPILLPVCMSLGMNSITFGIMLIFNLAIGLCTPPVGNALFIGCAVGKRRLENVVKQMLPLYGVMLVGLMLVTYVPFFTSWLPTLMGYLQ